MDDDGYIPFEGTPRPLTPALIDALRQNAKKALEQHKGILRGMTPEQHREISNMDPGPCAEIGRIPEKKNG